MVISCVARAIKRHALRVDACRVPAAAFRRCSFATTSRRLEEGFTETKAQEETHDVTTISNLLHEVRSHSNPAHSSLMPVRTPRLWSESLLTSGTESKPTTEAKPQDPVPRHMYDSYSQVVFPFSSSPELLEQYVNAWGGIRTGKLMEHLDSLAGSIAYKHMLGPTVETLGKINERGYYIVTASVDRLDMLSSLHPVRDIRLGGHVIYTGRSSMEVAVTMEALEGPGKERTVMLGRFSMVCRDAQTHKAHPVNPLIADTAEERRLLAIGESLKARKQLEAQHSLSRVPPSIEEAQELHGVYLSGLNRTEDDPQYEQVYMHTTKLEKTMLMFPQERNVHQKVFGGYLMRLAYELGFANATLFSRRKHLRFLSLDGIAFERPVSIGSILRLRSMVTHSSSKEYPAVVHVFVQANVVDPLTGAEQKTNDFRFTWCDDGGEPLQRVVVPQTYAESMRWIEGRRALEMGERIRGLRKLELS